jgi:enoyl-CoA hydratase
MAQANYEEILVGIEDSIGTITLNRPEARNAMTTRMKAEIGQAMSELDADPDVRAIIITAVGEKFSVGADFNAMRSGQWSSAFEARDPFHSSPARINSQLNIRVPTIAAINGDCVGGAATLALLCDLVYMEESARIGDPHVRSGAVAGDGGAIIWVMLLGPLRAKQYLMTGDLIGAQEAAQLGLANKVVPDGTAYKEARALARRFAEELPPVAVKWTKYAVNKQIRQSMMDALDVSLALELISYSSEDRQEAISAFLDKRKPTYKGR